MDEQAKGQQQETAGVASPREASAVQTQAPYQLLTCAFFGIIMCGVLYVMHIGYSDMLRQMGDLSDRRIAELEKRIDRLTDALQARTTQGSPVVQVIPVPALTTQPAPATGQQEPEKSVTTAEKPQATTQNADISGSSERNAAAEGKNAVAPNVMPATEASHTALPGAMIGRVLVANQGHLRAVISAGLDSALENGQRLSVWRDERCVAELRVLRRYADMTICEIVGEYQGGIRVNDAVRDGREQTASAAPSAGNASLVPARSGE